MAQTRPDSPVWLAIRQEGLSPLCYSMLVRMSSVAYKTWTYYQRQSELAEFLNIDRKTLRAGRDQLIARGLIERDRDASRRTVTYRLFPRQTGNNSPADRENCPDSRGKISRQSLKTQINNKSELNSGPDSDDDFDLKASMAALLASHAEGLSVDR